VPERSKTWTFLTNHAVVLLCLAREPDLRIRDLAARAEITERAAQKIVGDLQAEGYISVRKIGRRNSYTINANRHLRHPLQRPYRVRDLLAAFPVQAGSRGSRSLSPQKPKR